MVDYDGDPARRPMICITSGVHLCPNMKERDDTSMEGETYQCAVCGAHYFLDYEDMK